MIQPEARRAPDNRLGAEGHPQARFLKHSQIVGSITNRCGFSGSDLQLLAKFAQSLQLGLSPEYRGHYLPGKPPLLELEAIGADVVEAQIFADRFGKAGEAARHESAIAAMVLKCCHQGF